jgi:dihydrodipicolinate synthase/N-acetylneuraminate lyase
MKIEHLQGLISAPFSSLNNKGELNLDIIPAYYAFLKQNGVTGAFINGSTGEGGALTLNEKNGSQYSMNYNDEVEISSHIGTIKFNAA